MSSILLPLLGERLQKLRERKEASDVAAERRLREYESIADEAVKAVTPITHVTPARAVALALRALHRQGLYKDARKMADKQMARCAGDAEFLGVASLVYLDDDDIAKAEETAKASLASCE